MGMLPSSLRRHVGHGSHHAALQKLQQLLLHRFPAHVPGIGLLLFRDLVHLVDEDDASLRPFHIVICLG